ncbi:MAG TPA: 16S rRNA (uracil(1498)-N(3))-methyltransferase, partial [Firmicutes bacterium]|nr:16S rRNA (uracil(1498)-N(3))-methyltransferase [Bacillota bacterium]
MRYFFVEGTSLAEGQVVELLPEDVNHVYRVLRLREGAPVYIGDGRGEVFHGYISAADPRSVKVSLKQPVPSAEPPLNITLLQSLAKGEKMDLIVRQSVELGASRIIPVVTGRSIPKWDEHKERRRLARWQGIARSAASQCRRGRIPAVEPVAIFLE